MSRLLLLAAFAFHLAAQSMNLQPLPIVLPKPLFEDVEVDADRLVTEEDLENLTSEEAAQRLTESVLQTFRDEIAKMKAAKTEQP